MAMRQGTGGAKTLRANGAEAAEARFGAFQIAPVGASSTAWLDLLPPLSPDVKNLCVQFPWRRRFRPRTSGRLHQTPLAPDNTTGLHLESRPLAISELHPKEERTSYKRESFNRAPTWKITTKAVAIATLTIFIFTPCRFHVRIFCDASEFMRTFGFTSAKPVLLLSFPDTSPDYHRRSNVDLAYFRPGNDNARN
jgi:hypothetical protein